MNSLWAGTISFGAEKKSENREESSTIQFNSKNWHLAQKSAKW